MNIYNSATSREKSKIRGMSNTFKIKYDLLSMILLFIMNPKFSTIIITLNVIILHGTLVKSKKVAYSSSQPHHTCLLTSRPNKPTRAHTPFAGATLFVGVHVTPQPHVHD